MRHDLLTSSLYLNKIALSKEISRGNYLRNLPVISNLKKMGELKFNNGCQVYMSVRLNATI